jgi:hypothetical protein
VYDGRFANNGWLKELAKPISKLQDNAAMMSPATAEKLGVTHTIMARRRAAKSVQPSDIELSRSRVTAAAWVMPGQADGCWFFRWAADRRPDTGTNKGFNVCATGCAMVGQRRRVMSPATTIPGVHAVSSQRGGARFSVQYAE